MSSSREPPRERSEPPYLFKLCTKSKEIAERFAAEHPKRAAIAVASCRFELNSANDAGMDHFNDMIFICHAAEAMGEVYIFNPRANMKSPRKWCPGRGIRKPSAQPASGKFGH